MAQLKSQGFTVLYFHYDTVIRAFQQAGLDARFVQETPDAEIARKIRAWNRLSKKRRVSVANSLVELNKEEVVKFMETLTRAVKRQIELIRVIPLHGKSFEWRSVNEAIAFIETYDEKDSVKPVMKYEIEIRYNNGDHIQAQFSDKESAIRFLHGYQPPRLQTT